VLWPLRSRVARWRAGDHDGSDSRSLPAWAAVLSSLETGYRPAPPTRVFDDSLTIDGGDLTIELAWAGNAHTDNDVLAYVPQERLLFTGDLFASAGSLGFQVNPLADVPRLLRVLDGFLARGIDHAVPGHGAVMTGADIRSLRSLLAERYATFDGKRSAAQCLEQAITTADAGRALKRYDALPSQFYRSQEELSILGRRLQGQGRPAEAAAVFRAGLGEYPGSALLRHDLAGLHLALGQRDSARQYYRLVLQAVPGNRDAETMLEGLGGSE
jgi:glyoxylase-like metal-dependent hydrolase (beta-lactamase superfamily II)